MIKFSLFEFLFFSEEEFQLLRVGQLNRHGKKTPRNQYMIN